MEKKQDQRELRRHFISSLYDTLDSVVSPTPYMEITEGKKVDVKFLDGKARLPSPNSTEITVLDIDVASLFFDDFHVLYEGITGIGKTYTSDALFGTVFGPDGHHTLRLSGGVMGSSALEPFVTTTLENGVPKTRLDKEKCQKYGALFIDEINCGDPNEIFQVVDGAINLNGDTGYLQIPIPGTTRHKSLAVLAAMNPADAQHSHAQELTIAGENRFLKFKFPNGVAEAASSQLEKRTTEDLHNEFWTKFSEKTGMSRNWRESYPIVTDPEQFANALDGQTKEFIDVALGYVGSDPKVAYQRNADLIRQGGLQPAFDIKDDNSYRKILDAQSKLKHGFVRRDLKKIQDLSRLLAFVKGVKEGSYEAKVNLNDVAASIGIVLESKTLTGAEHGGLMALVNDARSAYAELHNKTNIPDGFGLREAIWESAVHVGNDYGFDAYMNTLNQGIATLNQQSTGASQAAIKSRIIADLVVLNHFSKAYKGEVENVLKEKGDKSFQAFGKLYEEKKSKGSIYEHRLGSILR